MEDSSHDSSSKNTIQYTVTVSGDEDDQRVFRDLIREEGAEIQSELPVDTDEEGVPQYLQDLVDQAVETLGEEDSEAPIEAAMDVVIPKVESLPVQSDVSERTVYDVLQDLQQLEALSTEERPESIDETDSAFDNYRIFHSSNDPDENQWGEATLKALTHASLEMYISQELKSIKNEEEDAENN